MAKAIGPNFSNEFAAALVAAGLATAQHVTWFADGTIETFPDTPAEVVTIAAAVYAAHDPATPDPRASAQALLAGGLAITSTGTPSLDGTYGTALPDDEANLTGMQAAVAAGVFPGFYRDKGVVKHTMTGAQFTAIATAILNFIVAVEEALDTAMAGGAWTPPSNAVTIA
jgi:hypothetical protein